MWSSSALAGPDGLRHTQKLKIALPLPTAQLVLNELSVYRIKVSEGAKDSYGNGRDAP